MKDTYKSIQYGIEAMCCPTEEGMIRKKLDKMQGIEELQFNLMQRVLTVRYTSAEPKAIQKAIKRLGFEAVPIADGAVPFADSAVPVMDRAGASGSDGSTTGELGSACTSCCGGNHNHADSATQPAPVKSTKKSFLKQWGVLIIAGIVAIAAEFAEAYELITPWLPLGLALAAVGLSGVRTYKMGWISIWQRSLNINTLMSIAVTGALIIGVWAEAAMVMVLFSLAEKLEGFSLDRARNAIKSLLDLSPDKATVQQPDGTFKEVDAAVVPIGATVRVRPGGRISHDGTVLQGATTIDQSAITGESLPVEKSAGDTLFAGTVNQQGEITFTVTADMNNSTLSRIIHLVEEAQGNRSATQRFVDSFAKVYTPLVILIALGIAVLPPFVLGGSWFDWVYRALAMLIIACPCALVVSTPVTIVSGLARASRMGMVVKGGVFLEQAAKLNWVALDKTGTITAGVPSLTNVVELIEGSAKLNGTATVGGGASTATGTLQAVADIRLLHYAASLAARSDHPISKAVAEGCVAKYKEVQLEEVENFTALTGKGTQGEIDGTTYYLGNHRLMEELGVCSPAIENQIKILEEQGKTTVMLATSYKALLLFAVADTIKETSQAAIATLHTLGVKTLMLSGDNQRTAHAIGLQAGIDDVQGSLLPEDKASVIKKLREQGALVGMVGDGINDAPALAHADIGIAMGGIGTDTAIEAADVILMDDDLTKVPLLIKLSRKTRRVLTENITIALSIKLFFMLLTVMGFGTMWMAVFADMGASLIVVFNGLKLLKKRTG